jgi:peptidoglycan hydrolase CwlO-like protein
LKTAIGNIKNEDRMIELLAEMVKNSDKSITQQKEMVSEMKLMRGDIHEMRGDIHEMKKDIRKHNVMLAEHSRAIIKLAENVDSFSAYDERISEIEKKVFKK